MYGDTGVTEVDWATGSTYSGNPVVDRHHLIFISSGSTQLRAFSRPGSIISSHFLPTLLELELFFLTNSVCALNRSLQMLLQLCSTTICGQIDHMYIYRDTYIIHAILWGCESCDCNKDKYDKRNASCYGHSWPQRHSVRLQCNTHRARRNGETAIGGWYATRCIVLAPGAEQSFTRVLLTAMMQPFRPDGIVLCWWSSSLSARWRLIGLIRRTFNTRVCPPGSFFEDKAGGTGDFFDNFNAAAPSCWKCDHDALTISSVSEMYPTAVICSFWPWDSFCVAHRFRLPSHISKMLWTLAIWCNFFCSASLFISTLLSVLVGFNSGSSSASNPLLARVNWLTMTFSRRVSPVVFDYLHPITSRPREQLASTPAPRHMIENISRPTLERSVYFECTSSCFRHQSVISGNQNVLLISIGLEW